MYCTPERKPHSDTFSWQSLDRFAVLEWKYYTLEDCPSCSASWYWNTFQPQWLSTASMQRNKLQVTYTGIEWETHEKDQSCIAVHKWMFSWKASRLQFARKERPCKVTRQQDLKNQEWQAWTNVLHQACCKGTKYTGKRSRRECLSRCAKFYQGFSDANESRPPPLFSRIQTVSGQTDCVHASHNQIRLNQK